MAIENTFQDLIAKIHRAQDVFDALRLTVVEDTPAEGSVVLIDQFGDAVEDVIGWLEEAGAAGSDARTAVAHPVDGHRGRLTLTVCQERFSRAVQAFNTDLIAYERMRALAQYGDGRKGEWRAWSRSVVEALGQCRAPLDDVSQALFMCWQELTERLGAGGLSVQTTTVGQNIRGANVRASEYVNRTPA